MRRAVLATNLPRRCPSKSKSGRTRPFASCPIGSGMFVKLCSPAEALGVGLRNFSFLSLGLVAMAGSIANAIDKSKIDNKQTARPQFPERPLPNGSMNSFYHAQMLRQIL